MSFTPLPWSDRLNTGVEEIDLQHRYFVRLINRLAHDLLTTQDERYSRGLLNELCKYATFHFASEENIMHKLGYPEMESHRLHHLQLLDKLSSYASGRDVERLLKFLTDWFIDHTVQEDRRIGDFIRNGGARQETPKR